MKKEIITCGCEAFGNSASMYHFILCAEECLCYAREGGLMLVPC